MSAYACVFILPALFRYCKILKLACRTEKVPWLYFVIPWSALQNLNITEYNKKNTWTETLLAWSGFYAFPSTKNCQE